MSAVVFAENGLRGRDLQAAQRFESEIEEAAQNLQEELACRIQVYGESQDTRVGLSLHQLGWVAVAALRFDCAPGEVRRMVEMMVRDRRSRPRDVPPSDR